MASQLATVVHDTSQETGRKYQGSRLKNADNSDDQASIAFEQWGADSLTPAKDHRSTVYSGQDPPLGPEYVPFSSSGVSHVRSSSLNTPATRTGPPRSLSFAYSLPQSPAVKTSAYANASSQEDGHMNVDLPPSDLSGYYYDLDEDFFFSQSGTPVNASDFRTPLEYPQRDSSYSSGKDHGHRDKGKRRSTEDSWFPKPLRWFHDSPREERSPSGTADSYFPLTRPELPPLSTTSANANISNTDSVLATTLTDEPTESESDQGGHEATNRDATAEPQPPTNIIDKSISSLLKRRREKPQSLSHHTPENRPELRLQDLSPIPVQSTHSRAISMPSSPKTPFQNRKLKRRWSFTFHTKGSSMGTPHRQLSVDGVGESKEDGTQTGGAPSRWNKLRSLLAHLQTEGGGGIQPSHTAVLPNIVNITDELITGGLATLMPKLWIERDEKGHRRVPVLLHRLRLRITDSLHPLHKSKSVFRIECEYANGAARWVVYRELKDFITLHGHYTVAHAVKGASNLGNLGARVHERLPEFPTTSLPYLKFLNKDNTRNISKAEFARLQREQLEDYLINLIRAVMFHPSSNRLAAFLEISALSISLAQSGGAQFKAGYLRVEATQISLLAGGSRSSNSSKGSTPGFGRKSANWQQRREWRWFSVRESYLVGMEEPGELGIWDVFLLDSDFRIERPKRYYRQGLGLLHYEPPSDDDEKTHGANKENGNAQQAVPNDGTSTHHRRSDSGHTRMTSTTGHNSYLHAHFAEGTVSSAYSHRQGDTSMDEADARIALEPPIDDNKSVMSSIKSKVSRIFHRDDRSKKRSSSSSRPTSSGRHLHGYGSDSSGEDETPRGALTPLLDPSVHTNPILTITPATVKSENAKDKGETGKFNSETTADDNFKQAQDVIRKHTERARAKGKDVSRHTFYIVNSQMRVKIHARTERQMLQFIAALERTAQLSPYVRHNRFDSFAPIRLNVSAQWLVDGRDYFWNLSRAILLARESIYIQDWWLSPELLMRRPDKDHYRLDRLLERKAKEGVKIYIMIYLEVSNRTTPIDSNYTKQRLTGLHPNVMVQRSPSHFQTGTFYWAHHEKLCVIDQTIAFMGGLDLCFGRWDTPQHALTDDTLDTDNPELWPGKDYSNPRVADFSNLSRPEEDMYDRTKVPRMPWHDVALQIVGQPARDLARHFVQRWNYLLRIKNHSRAMPFLLPPPEFRPGELHQMGLTGTCELQICRSAGPWSTGTPGKIEHSIQNAYLKAIQMSEHFVYIENQFFITSTTIHDVKVENKIGDALVHRIIRAHRDGTPWKCCVMLPLLPGFTFPVDHSDASAIRIILECQNRTIARGPDSIFSRLRREGIDPDEYISFFSLRNWGKMRGDVLTTEEVYIHAKICIVDDRLAIIGSANINERSQRGDRDSELAAVIRDTDMINGTMAGRPFQVGRFAHTLRVRLMREHLGMDVDATDEEDLMARQPVQTEYEQEEKQTPWDPDQEQEYEKVEGVTRLEKPNRSKGPIGNLAQFGASQASQALHGGAEALAMNIVKGVHAVGFSQDSAVQRTEVMGTERQDYDSTSQKRTGFASSAVPTLEEKTLMEGRPRKESIARRHNGHDVQQDTIEEETDARGCQTDSDTDSGKAMTSQGNTLENPPPPRSRSRSRSNVHLDGAPPRASVDTEGDDRRLASDIRSTLKNNASSSKSGTWTVPTARPKIDFDDFEDPICDSFWKDKWVASAAHNTEIYRKVFHAIPDDLVTTWKQYKEFVLYHDRLSKPVPGGVDPVARVPSESGEEIEPQVNEGLSDTSKEGQDSAPPEAQREVPSSAATNESFKRSRPAKGSDAFEKWEREQMEKLLNELNGHLVIYPTRFLEGEDIANNFLFNADRLLPLPIYN